MVNKPTIDIALIYYNSVEYDNSNILNNLLYRLYNLTDYLDYKDLLNFTIIDSGSTDIQLEKTLEVVNKWNSIKKIGYIYCDTSEIRKTVPKEMICRPFSHVANIGMKNSTADVYMICVIGQLFSKDHFKNILAQHISNNKAVLLANRFDLDCLEYHDKYFDMPFDELIKTFPIKRGGGWSDFSCRREHLLAIGGFDEEYITIAPNDMDIGSRLTGKLDNGMPSEMLYPDKGAFTNYGLDFIQPNTHNFISLVCNQFKNHIDKTNVNRQLSYNHGIEYYLKNWGIIERNKEKKFIVDYKIIM